MRVLFCRPLGPQGYDDGFDLEADALELLGVEPLWMPADVIDGRMDAALDRLEGAGTTLLRSWMFTADEYSELYEALADRGCYLVNDPAAYAAAHYLPSYFEAIEPWAAPTRWIDGTDLDEAWEVARELGPPPYLLKDHVKSVKETWSAGLVGAGADRAEFDRVCEAFIEQRGEHFERGLVFRSVLPLAPLAPGPSGHPVYDEYRLFFWEGSLLYASPYADPGGLETDFSRFEALGDRVDSRFFTADVARLTDGGWAVIEVGDGGVSGLPPLADPRELYRALFERWPG